MNVFNKILAVLLFGATCLASTAYRCDTPETLKRGRYDRRIKYNVWRTIPVPEELVAGLSPYVRDQI